MSGFDEAKQKIKEILDETAEGTTMQSQTINIAIYHARDRVLAVLGDLQKTHVLVDKEELQLLIDSLRTKVCCAGHAPDIWAILKENQIVKEKAEKLLEPTTK